jgi:hypothetical protein
MQRYLRPDAEIASGERSATQAQGGRNMSGGRRRLRRATLFALSVLGALVVPCVILLTTGQALPFGTATSATPPRALTPGDIEELVAPIALYPDAVLAQMLAASAQPQEVLDAGNWLVQNEALDAPARLRASAAMAFSTPVRSLLQFPAVLDMMCSQMDWTWQLGKALHASPATVVDAVQRLRRQAMALGNLRSTLQQRVLSQPEADGAIVSVQPVGAFMYVPIYDPQVVFNTSSLERHAVPGAREGVQVVMRFVAFAAGVAIADAFDRDYGTDYTRAEFGAYFGGRLLSDGAAHRPTDAARVPARQDYRRPSTYQYAYDARKLGVMNSEYFRHFDGNANLMGEPSALQLTATAAAMK